MAVITLSSLLAAAQSAIGSSRASSRAWTTSEISEYLIAGDDPWATLSGKNPRPLSLDEILRRMAAASARRSAELRGFESRRTYHLEYHGFLGGRDAKMEVVETYSAPDKRRYAVVSESGSKLLVNRVLAKLLDSERQAFADRRQIELSPVNYRFRWLTTESLPDGGPCYVLSVEARKDSPFLYNGRIWVEGNDFSVMRMEGTPAKSPSFWIRDTEIESNWQKIEDFWFIVHNRSVSHIRMGGMAVLTIDYSYQVRGADRHAAGPPGQSPVLPDPSAVTPGR